MFEMYILYSSTSATVVTTTTTTTIKIRGSKKIRSSSSRFLRKELLTTTQPKIILLLLLLLVIGLQLSNNNNIIYCMAFRSISTTTTSTTSLFVRSFLIRRQQQSQQYHHSLTKHQQHQSTTTYHQSRRRISFNSITLFSSSSSSEATDIMSSSSIIQGPEIPPLATNAKRIFWIRHGEVINPGGTRNVYYGAQDVPLSELGKAEAIAAAQYLQQFHLSNVYSSTLSRAIYGAERVIDYQQNNNKQQQQQQSLSSDKGLLQLVQVPGFIELDRGAWCGLTIEEVGRENMARFDACDESITPVGGESYLQLRDRVLAARDNIVLQQMEPGTAAAVVCHLQVTRCIVADALQIPTSDMVAKVSIATASITCIDYNVPNNNNNDDNDTTTTTTATLHYKSFKPADVIGLQKAKDGAN